MFATASHWRHCWGTSQSNPRCKHASIAAMGNSPQPQEPMRSSKPLVSSGYSGMVDLRALTDLDTRQLTDADSIRYAHLLWEVMCRAASFKVRELICRCIALAADPDGTFAIARMQPVFRCR